MKQRSFLGNMVDSMVIYVAEKYGMGTEEDVLKKENQDLRYHYLVEKTKRLDERTTEVTELRKEVKRLTEDKIRLLERDIERLEYENQYYKQIAYKEGLPLEEGSFRLQEVERFSYKENYIKCILKNGSTHVSPLSEDTLVRMLEKRFPRVGVDIRGSVLTFTYTEGTNRKIKEYPLDRYVSLGEVQKQITKEGAL